MESLYRKYRPLTFESVVGQGHIVSTLEHAVGEGRLSHAYLFCGPRGTGKTTMARILAKALLCEKAPAAREAGASGCMPDGTCEECRQIAEGTHPDVYELDAASRTGVDNVREEIIGSVNFAPVRGAYKVYIIDEVHMLTTAAFNALLKTLEEPPGHVVFVLCTTDPQKIPETILSRCQRFDFHRIGNDDIVRRLAYICEQEGFAYDDEALEVVAKHARGGMRDALSTLEQLSVFGAGAVHIADARALLGEVSGAVLGDFTRAIAARDAVRLFGLVREQVDGGGDLMELTRDLVAHVRDVYLARVAGAAAGALDASPDEVSALAEEAALFEGADRLARILTVLDDAALEMRNAPDTRLVLEIALTRLARPESDLTLEALAERVERLEARLASGVPAAPVDAAGLVSPAGAVGASARPGATGSHPAPAEAPTAGAMPSDPVQAVPAEGHAASSQSAGVPVQPAQPAAGGLRVEAPARSMAGSTPSTAAADGAPAGFPHPSAPTAGAPREQGGASPVAPAGAHAPSGPDDAEGGSSSARVAPHARMASPAQDAASGERPAPAAADPSSHEPQGAAPAGAPGPDPEGSRRRVPAVSAPASTAADRGAADPQGPASQTSASQEAPAGTAPAASGDAASAPAGEGAVQDPGELQRRWAEVVRQVTAAQPSRGALLQSSRAVRDDGDTLTVGLPAGSAFAIKMLGREDTQAVVLPQVSAVFGHRKVVYTMGGDPAPAPGTPAAAPARPAPAAAPASGAPSAAGSVPSGAASQDGRAAVASRGASAAEAPAAHGFSAASGASAPSAPAPHATPASAQASAADAPSAAVDQTSGPTIMPEPSVEDDRRAWEHDVVPYDDAFIASYEEGEDLPPFDMPDDASPVESAPFVPFAQAARPAPPAGADAEGAATRPSGGAAAGAGGRTPASDGAVAGEAPSAAPFGTGASASTASAPGAAATGPAFTPTSAAAAQFASEVNARETPHSTEEAKEMLGNIFGSGVIFKDA